MFLEFLFLPDPLNKHCHQRLFILFYGTELANRVPKFKKTL